MLLLGGPGTGKTTTLEYYAHAMAERARAADDSASLPIVLNLSRLLLSGDARQASGWLTRWRRQTPDRVKDLAFDERLATMVARLPVRGLTPEIVKLWIDRSQVVLVLDGLDEVHENAIGPLIEQLNQQFFPKFPDLRVIVASRIAEYETFRSRKETRLRLQGAVVLRPFEREQIYAYLQKTGATGLIDVLKDDEGLYELAKTPLTLSIMRLAYMGQRLATIPRDRSLAERRQIIFDRYVDRMMQRAARRKAGKPLDDNPELDEHTEYPAEKVFHWLGWLAVQLSTRMQTQLPIGDLTSFLASKPGWAGIKLVYRTAGVIAAVLVSALIGILLRENWTLYTSYIVASVPVLASLFMFGTPIFDLPDRSGLRLFVIRTGQIALGLLIGTSVIFTIWMATGYVSAVLSISSGLVFLIAISLTAAVLPPEGPRLASILKLLLCAGLFAATTMLFAGEEWWTLGLGAGLVVGIGLILFADENLTAVLVIGGIVGAVAGGIELASHFWAYREPSVAALAAGLVAGSLVAEERNVEQALLLACACILGAVFVGAAGVFLFGFFIILLLSSDKVWKIDSGAKRFLLDPLVPKVGFIRRETPLRLDRFLGYCRRVFLMRAVEQDYAFIHRLLRDYFAIRELLPRLYHDGQVRTEVVDQLSMQGESAYGALSELADHPDEKVRAAAVAGLSRIPLSESRALLNQAFDNDQSALVRAAAVRGTRRTTADIAEPIRVRAFKDPAPEVRRAVAVTLTEVSSNHEEDWGDLRRKYSESLLALLRDSDAMVIKAAVLAISAAHISPESGSHLSPVLRASLQEMVLDGSPVEKVAGLRLLEQPDDDVFDLLASAATDKDEEARLAAVAGIAARSDASASDLLLQMLDDRSHRVRTRIVTVLRFRIRTKGAMSDDQCRRFWSYLPRGIDDRESLVRWVAIDAAGDCGRIELLRKIERRTRDRHESVRSSAVAALVELRGEQAVPFLLSALGDRKLVEPAALGLARLSSPKLRDLLHRQLRSFSAVRRIGAVKALGRIADFRADAPDRLKILQVLRRTQDDRLERLLSAIEAFLLTEKRSPRLGLKIACMHVLEKFRFREIPEEIERETQSRHSSVKEKALKVASKIRETATEHTLNARASSDAADRSAMVTELSDRPARDN